MDIIPVLISRGTMEQMSLGQMQALFFIVPVGGLAGIYIIAHILENKLGYSQTKSRITATLVVLAAIAVIALVLRAVYGRQTGFVV